MLAAAQLIAPTDPAVLAPAVLAPPRSLPRSGLSSRAVLSSAAQTIIVYLYLLDAEGVNQIILATYTVSTVLELWKVVKVLTIMRMAKQRAADAVDAAAAAASDASADAAAAAAAAADAATTGAFASASASPTPAPTAIVAAAAATKAAKVEAATERYDQVATRTLGIGLAPLVGGWAIYALFTYPHTSWYSWVVSSLADAVYLFGFVGMTPQVNRAAAACVSALTPSPPSLHL